MNRQGPRPPGISRPPGICPPRICPPGIRPPGTRPPGPPSGPHQLGDADNLMVSQRRGGMSRGLHAESAGGYGEDYPGSAYDEEMYPRVPPPGRRGAVTRGIDDSDEDEIEAPSPDSSDPASRAMYRAQFEEDVARAEYWQRCYGPKPPGTDGPKPPGMGGPKPPRTGGPKPPGMDGPSRRGGQDYPGAESYYQPPYASRGGRHGAPPGYGSHDDDEDNDDYDDDYNTQLSLMDRDLAGRRAQRQSGIAHGFPDDYSAQLHLLDAHDAERRARQSGAGPYGGGHGHQHGHQHGHHYR